MGRSSVGRQAKAACSALTLLGGGLLVAGQLWLGALLALCWLCLEAGQAVFRHREAVRDRELRHKERMAEIRKSEPGDLPFMVASFESDTCPRRAFGRNVVTPWAHPVDADGDDCGLRAPRIRDGDGQSLHQLEVEAGGHPYDRRIGH